ncbi:alpha/beta hydrolase fold family protein [Acinetobacter sp. HA]|uniref:alpha/beta hydrolase n=1 Tax=Acinetobacter sp. HA TaxID=1173062 RepID=UPI000263DDAA|nr:alpha/beta hydrolase [Acinetobacter sp. HA]EIM38220.1 alpha/beta hydrolase fold family protein [Acinetobacter sp. HA]EIM38394.1 alpha/beta hydrolase fold family protein [Acinetobacter sp. HA]
MTTKIEVDYQPDILGAGYEQATLDLPNDYEGQVVATLVRKKAAKPTKKAVLYIHGFIDYFFQTEMAERFNEQGFDFYALDLRKYGRSYLPHQKYYNVHSLSEYDAEITQALDIIGQESHDAVLLCGHSTGGLTTTLYAAHHPDHPLIKALWANSPFYDFNMSRLEKKFAIPRMAAMGKRFPNLLFPSRLNKWYVPSLHASHHGEWNFNLEWKKVRYPMVRLSFVHAIHEAQKELHQGLQLSIPVLIMHSHQTTYPRKFNRHAQSSDVILEVQDMIQHASKISGDVTLCEIHNGLHDLVLSEKAVREQVYQQLFEWLHTKGL